MNNIFEQVSYLMDESNLIYENKVWIDLMWYVSKEKFTSKDKNGKSYCTVKSGVVRNAGVIFQKLFYWHNFYIKNNKKSKYQYKNKNVIKMDHEDWWEDVRLTAKEVTSANKFLIDADLIEIVKMRIKVKDTEVFKPCNCYMINVSEVEKYLEKIIDIKSIVYKEKVEKYKENNNRTSENNKKSTKISTDNSVTSVTDETLETQGLKDMQENISTLSTEKTQNNNPVTPITDVTIVTPVTDVTNIVTPVTDVTNKSEKSYTKKSYTERSEETPSPSPSVPNRKIDVTLLLETLKTKVNPTQFECWFEQSIKTINIKGLNITITTMSNFTKDILQDRFMDEITDSIALLTSKSYKVILESEEN